MRPPLLNAVAVSDLPEKCLDLRLILQYFVSG